ncbi:MAG: hypothetical protein D6B27_02850 [Gammaproteobacteria bacterium]|nr:MAG: hypothetical protein D6B27_02850 [Gammaproteobacteria bacterium]
MKKILIIISIVLLSGCNTTSTKTSSASDAKKDAAIDAMADKILTEQILKNGEYLLCDQESYTNCHSISQSACVVQMRHYKSTCHNKALESIDNKDPAKNGSQYQKNYIVCMMLQHLLENTSRTGHIEKIGQCIKEIQLDKKQLQKSLFK